MEDFTDDQLHIMISALQDFADSQKRGAENWAVGSTAEERIAATGRDIVEQLMERAKEANLLRAGAAFELHRRGRVACSLAHPNGPCPLDR